MKHPLIDPNKSYTFRNYFELNPPLDELLAQFGYTRQTELCTLPKAAVESEAFSQLQRQLETHMRIADLIITIGEAWRFAILDRQRKEITQDINLYRVPADLVELVQMLVAILRQ